MCFSSTITDLREPAEGDRRTWGPRADVEPEVSPCQAGADISGLPGSNSWGVRRRGLQRVARSCVQAYKVLRWAQGKSGPTPSLHCPVHDSLNTLGCATRRECPTFSTTTARITAALDAGTAPTISQIHAVPTANGHAATTLADPCPHPREPTGSPWDPREVYSSRGFPVELKWSWVPWGDVTIPTVCVDTVTRWCAEDTLIVPANPKRATTTLHLHRSWSWNLLTLGYTMQHTNKYT